MKITGARFKQAEIIRTIYTATPEIGTSPEEMLVPSYWAHVARSLIPGDRIETHAADGDWFAEFYVQSASATEARVFPLRIVHFNASAAPAITSDEFEVKFRGRAKWSVLRKSDRIVMVDGLDTEGAALEWLANRLENGAG